MNAQAPRNSYEVGTNVRDVVPARSVPTLYSRALLPDLKEVVQPYRVGMFLILHKLTSTSGSKYTHTQRR